jgi:putative ABC transport system ATP-binding protein
MIRTEQLTKIYRGAEVETRALDGIGLDIRAGEFVAVMGPSGCGKSTLLNLLGLLDRPTRGAYQIFGQETLRLSERERAHLRKGSIGFVFQSFNLIDELTIYENVELPLLYLGSRGAERRERVQQALERSGIVHRANHHPQQLSGGQQQRAAVARAIVADPKLILADEPTGNLDSTNGEAIMCLLGELNGAGTTIVMVTHSATDAAHAHRVVRLFDGCIAAEEILPVAAAPSM